MRPSRIYGDDEPVLPVFGNQIREFEVGRCQWRKSKPVDPPHPILDSSLRFAAFVGGHSGVSSAGSGTPTVRPFGLRTAEPGRRRSVAPPRNTPVTPPSGGRVPAPQPSSSVPALPRSPRAAALCRRARDRPAARFADRVLTVSDAIGRRWGVIPGTVKRVTGQAPPVIDTLFAATAYLAARNVKDVRASGAATFSPLTTLPRSFPISPRPGRRP